MSTLAYSQAVDFAQCHHSKDSGFCPVRFGKQIGTDRTGRDGLCHGGKSGWMHRLQDENFYILFDSWSGDVKPLEVETPSPRSGVDSAGRGATGSAPPEPSVATISFLGWLRPRRCIFGRERNFSSFISSFDRWRWWDDKRSQLALLVAHFPFLADPKRRVGYRRDRHPAPSLGDVSFNFPLHAQATVFDVTSTFPSLSDILAASNNSTFSDATAATWGPSVLSPPPATTASAIPSTNPSSSPNRTVIYFQPDFTLSTKFSSLDILQCRTWAYVRLKKRGCFKKGPEIERFQV